MLFTLYNLKNYSILLICFALTAMLLACSKKADNDVEIREMIVGTWKAKITQSIGSARYHIMEFTHDGRYRELEYDGIKSTWNSADTSGLDSMNHIVSSLTTFEDSVFYEINQSKVIYNIENLSWPASAFAPKEKKIFWIKPDKMKIEDFNNNYKYEKI